MKVRILVTGTYTYSISLESGVGIQQKALCLLNGTYYIAWYHTSTTPILTVLVPGLLHRYTSSRYSKVWYRYRYRVQYSNFIIVQ
jgi:hypothetical protein